MEKYYVLKTTRKEDILPFFRHRSNLKREEIIKKLNVSSPTFRNWEKRPSLIPIKALDTLSELYGEDFRDMYMEEKLYNE